MSVSAFSVIIILINESLSNEAIVAIIAIIISVVGSIVFLIFRSGKVMEHIENIDKDLDEIKVDVKMIPAINTKVETLWAKGFTTSSSPIELNEKGKKILKDSGIKEIISKYYDSIVTEVRNGNPKNAYQAQQQIINAVKNLKLNKDCIDDLEKRAFKSGADVDTILYVGAIDIRDKILTELGFKKEDIDKRQ